MPRRDAALTGPGMMLLSAALFGYFGFFNGIVWNTPSSTTGQPVLQWVLAGWTLRGSAVGFAVAAGLAFPARRAANFLYAGVGLLGAALFLVVLVLAYLDKQHAPVVPRFLLVVFAAWNGYGSWAGLRALLARPRAGGADAGR